MSPYFSVGTVLADNSPDLITTGPVVKIYIKNAQENLNIVLLFVISMFI